MARILPGVGGIVLCGGQSSRMGQPKARLPVDGEPLLTRTVRVLSEAVSPVIVAAAPGQELPSLPGEVRIVRDELPGRGPLGGLAAALAGMEAESAFVAACDLPRLSAALIRSICEHLSSASPLLACVPRVDGQPQPLAAVYRKDVFGVLRQHLAAGRYSMRELLGAIDVVWLDGLDAEAFANVNTMEDYRRLQP
jgi:molybdopterin-guanine dinucleotide biosynthesis protein A